MKRFFCTVCRRVKRVQQLPRNVGEPEALHVQDRIGTCNKHATRADDKMARRGGTRLR